MNNIIPINIFINLQEFKIQLRRNPSEKDNLFIELFRDSIITEKGISRNKNVRKDIKTTNKSLEIVE